MMNIAKRFWGHSNGRSVYLFTLANDNMEVVVSNFGATITAIHLPGTDGEKDNVVLGYDTLEGYIQDQFYTGCVVGRFAGRIADASFAINGVSYALAQNENSSVHLHGGIKGFGKQVFSVVQQKTSDASASVQLYYRSRHLEEGYPGNLDVWITYELSVNNELYIRYHAITDQRTHINLTNHSYFNLADKDATILNHSLFINADHYLQLTSDHLPTGVIEPVAGTGCSFKEQQVIHDGMLLRGGKGYNECYVLNKHVGEPSAVLSEHTKGRSVVVYTDMPALLLYTGDYLEGKFNRNSGLCLETQFFPDAPNHKTFPATLLNPGDEWKSTTRFLFTWNDDSIG